MAGSHLPPSHWRDWLHLMRPGDWLLLTLLCGLLATSLPRLWQSGPPDRAMVRQGGQVVGEYPLDHAQQIAVSGPLGTTLIAIETGRARVLSDPGPRQYCVRQGWLTRPGEVALCAPNQVSLHLLGRLGQTARYDSIAY